MSGAEKAAVPSWDGAGEALAAPFGEGAADMGESGLVGALGPDVLTSRILRDAPMRPGEGLAVTGRTRVPAAPS